MIRLLSLALVALLACAQSALRAGVRGRAASAAAEHADDLIKTSFLPIFLY
jgi:hypothetical protein